jgi:uncharacterized protein YdcH (DUF465 family)
MTRQKLEAMSVEELVARFEAIALGQDDAIFNDDNARYNRLFREMDALKQELKSREGDQRRALLPLLEHKNGQVRLKAAIATLAVEANAARQTVQEISDSNVYPEAANARGMISAIDEGRYVPS